jgi:hypothetical protein
VRPKTAERSERRPVQLDPKRRGRGGDPLGNVLVERGAPEVSR